MSETGPIAFVSILDASSPTHDGFEAVKNGVAAMLNLLRRGDRFAVVAYDEQARAVYPRSGLATNRDAARMREATMAVLDVAALNPEADAAQGIAQGAALLAHTRGSRRALLLARHAGRTAAPLRPGDGSPPPMDTLGVGPSSPDTLLRAVSAATFGVFMKLTDAVSVAEAFFELVARLGIGRREYLARRDLTTERPMLVGNTVAGSRGFSLALLWRSVDVAPFSITFVDPSGNAWNGEPVFDDGGYVIFNEPKATAGDWSFTIQLAEGAKSCSIAVAGFNPE